MPFDSYLSYKQNDQTPNYKPSEQVSSGTQKLCLLNDKNKTACHLLATIGGQAPTENWSGASIQGLPDNNRQSTALLVSNFTRPVKDMFLCCSQILLQFSYGT